MDNLRDGFRAVVIGSSGGIGGAFCSALKADGGCREVVELSRNSTPPVDLVDEQNIEVAAATVAAGGPVHLIVDATGILYDEDMWPEKSLNAISADAMARSFAVNATGPLLLIKHFHRLMPRDERSVFATLSARVGSISDNELGGWYSYRTSKAALNMGLRSASIELARKLPQAVLLALHPGTVSTRLSDPFAGSRDRFDPDHAVSMMLGVMGNVGPGDTGSFLAYDGTRIPW